MESSIFKGIKRFGKGLGIWLLATVGQIILGPIAALWSLILVCKRGQLGEYLRKVGIAKDAFLNVLCGAALDKTLKKSGGYSFGHRRDTISYAMGINDFYNNLSKFGLGIKKFLNFVDNNHLEKSIKHIE